MINIKELKEGIIEPVLLFLKLDNDIRASMQQILGTSATESDLGKFRKQIGGGPALGIFQMEPLTHDDIWDNYLRYRTDIVDKIKVINDNPIYEDLEYNDAYATAMCRIHYYRSSMLMPNADDIEAMAHMWKVVYNTKLGKGTEEKFIEKYNKYVKGEI